MSHDDVLDSGLQHIILATGSHWRRDGIGRDLWQPIPGHELPHVYSPDDLMARRLPSGHVLIFDNDHFYMGGVLAEMLATAGCEVTLVTPAPMISYWTQYTLEQERIQRRLMNLGVHAPSAVHTYFYRSRPNRSIAHYLQPVSSRRL